MSPPAPTTSTKWSSTKTSNPGRALAPGEIFLGLGSNLGDSEAVLLTALAVLATGLGPLTVSSPYRSTAIGDGSQPDYLNAVATGRTDLAPEALAALGKATERRAGRRSGARWAPRILDVDLLLCAGRERSTPELTLPHPLLRQRAFVLAPLSELVPDLALPPDGATPLELLDFLRPTARDLERRSWTHPIPAGVRTVAAALEARQ